MFKLFIDSNFIYSTYNTWINIDFFIQLNNLYNVYNWLNLGFCCLRTSQLFAKYNRTNSNSLKALLHGFIYRGSNSGLSGISFESKQRYLVTAKTSGDIPF
jgi:hypothetical protein